MQNENTGVTINCPLPASARKVLRALEDAGAEAWVVGGWVRDAVLGKGAHDVDIATSACWRTSAAALRSAGIAVYETGTAHGTVTAVVDGTLVEVTTYRIDGEYADHRHPDEVRFVDSVHADLARRDLTINAMAYHPTRGLLDPYGGAEDLAAGIIRTVGDPVERFSEDALRVLRTVRFACRLRAAIDARTHDALVAAAPDLCHVASERIGAELDAIVATGRVGWALMTEPEVMGAAIPELTALYGFDQRSPYHAYDVAEHTARVCKACEAFTAGQASRALRWAALLHDVAKPATFSVDEGGRGHFFGHPEVGERMARAILRRLALPSTLVREVCTLVRWHDLPLNAQPATTRRLLLRLERACPGKAAPLAYALLDLKRADAISKVASAAAYATEIDAMTSLVRSELATCAPLCARDLAIDGSDVMMAAGLTPGPAVGLTLDVLLRAVVDDGVPNERQALLGLVRHMRGRAPDLSACPFATGGVSH